MELEHLPIGDAFGFPCNQYPELYRFGKCIGFQNNRSNLPRSWTGFELVDPSED